MNAALVSPPPSTSRCVHPSRPSLRSSDLRLNPRLTKGQVITRQRCLSWAKRLAGASRETTTVVCPASSSLSTREPSGVRARGSRMMRRSGSPCRSALGRRMSRSVSAGLSARIVFTPTRMASASCRSFIPSRRASRPVIHFDSPPAVAILPSSVIAAFTVTNGSPAVIQWLNAKLISAASSASTPRSTATPLRLSHRKARPAWAGFGSVAATTTLEMPASMMACVQGGVRPLVEHGSSVT